MSKEGAGKLGKSLHAGCVLFKTELLGVKQQQQNPKKFRLIARDLRPLTVIIFLKLIAVNFWHIYIYLLFYKLECKKEKISSIRM